MNQKKITNLEVLKSIPTDDIRVILNGYLGSENADPSTYIKIYELYCHQDRTIMEIAEICGVIPMNIRAKIHRMVLLVKRDPILTSRLRPDTDIFQIPIERLILSHRTYFCLRRANLMTVGDVLKLGEQGLLRIYNLGRRSLNEIKTVLWGLMTPSLEAYPVAPEVEELKNYSLGLAEKSAQWTQQDHDRLWKVLGDLQGRLAETNGMIEMVLKSAIPHMIEQQEGFLVPYAVWKKLLSITRADRIDTETILDVLRTPDDKPV
jgi:hypothetical protein